LCSIVCHDTMPMRRQIVNIPCGHLSYNICAKCPECALSNEDTARAPTLFAKCRYGPCSNAATSMFLPCKCVFFCTDHAALYVDHNIGNGMCPDSRFLEGDGDCDSCIDSIVDIVVSLSDCPAPKMMVDCDRSDFGMHDESDSDEM